MGIGVILDGCFVSPGFISIQSRASCLLSAAAVAIEWLIQVGKPVLLLYCHCAPLPSPPYCCGSGGLSYLGVDAYFVGGGVAGSGPAPPIQVLGVLRAVSNLFWRTPGSLVCVLDHARALQTS